jgi:hypothetical protein
METQENTNAVKDLINDQYFRNRVIENLKELLKTRRSRPSAKPGYRYTRDWYDRMREQSMLNESFFIDNIESIWNKKSSLSSEIRQIIQHVCNISAQQTFRWYEDLKENAQNQG